MKNLLLILVALFAFACGGVPDTTDPDTHRWRRQIAETAAGPVVRWTDMGFDWQIGSVEQALTVVGRHGVDNTKPGDASESRCPSTGYTGNPSIPGNACTIPRTKSLAWWEENFSDYDAAYPGSPIRSLFASAMTGASSGTSFGHYYAADYNDSRYLAAIGDAAVACDYSGPALTFGCADQTFGAIILNQSGERFQKDVPSGGWYGYLTVDLNDMSSWNATQTQANNFFYNVAIHELGHFMGLGHSLASGTVMKVGANCTTGSPCPFNASEKADLTAYVP